MGTMLYAKGIFLNRCFDELNLTQPDLVRDVPHVGDPSLLVGLAPFDDAAIYRLTDDLALVTAAVAKAAPDYDATGKSVDVFAADGKFVGTIPGPQGLHGTFFGGKDRKTLYGIVFYGTWGTPSARNAIIAIPTISQGYTGRAK